MKTILTSALAALLLCSVLALDSCKNKDDPKPGAGTTTPPTTVSTAPALDNAATTTTSSDITAETAKVSSTISANGGAAITQHGHVWSDTKPEPTTADAKTELGKTDGPFPLKFTSDLKSLKANTTYNVRAYATNDKGTSYGTAVQMKTTATGTPTTNLADWKTARLLGEGLERNLIYHLIADASGNFYAIGYYNSNGGKLGKFPTRSGENGFVAKLDPVGEPLWVIEFTKVRLFGGGKLDLDAAGNLYATIQTNDKDAVFGSTTLSHWGGYTAKITPDGKVEWVRSFGISYDRSSLGASEVDAQGNCYVVGRIAGNKKVTVGTATLTGTDPAWKLFDSSEGYDSFIARFDPAGKLLWTRQFTGDGRQTVQAIDVSPNGSAYVDLLSDKGPSSVGGTTLATAGEFLLKLSPSGTVDWNKTIHMMGGLNNGHISKILCKNTGELLVQSYSKSGISIGGVTTGNSGPALVVYREDGTLKWATLTPTSVGGSDLDKSGNLYVFTAGSQYSPFTIGTITLPAQKQDKGSYQVVAKYSPTQDKWLWAVRNSTGSRAFGLGNSHLAVSSAGVPLAVSSFYQTDGDIQFGSTTLNVSKGQGVFVATIEPK